MGFNKLPKLLPLCIGVLMVNDAMSLGLGAVNLDTKLGQPLFARIPVFGAEGVGSPDVLITLESVVDPDTGFDIGNIDTRSLSVAGEIQEDGSGTIYLRSDTPINEPYLYFSIKVRWPSGALTRDYTLLLDLPDSSSIPENTALTDQTVSSSNSSATVKAPPSDDLSLPLQTDAMLPPIVSSSQGSRLNTVPSIGPDTAFYMTARGDSLWSIARRVARAKGGTANDWMSRLYSNNPGAFIRNNRNLLKERVTLDLFDSVLESKEVPPTPSIKPKDKQEQLLTSGVTKTPSGPRPEVLNPVRREREDDNEPVEEALTESQFLNKNLSDVQTEFAEVSENITAMTKKLALLQSQLDDLNAQVKALNGVDSTNKAEFADDEGFGEGDLPQRESTVIAVSPEDGVNAGEIAALAAEGNQAVDAPPGNTSVVNLGSVKEASGVTAVTNNIDGDTAESTNAVSSTWSWLWWFVPVVGLILLLLRYRKASRENDSSFVGHDTEAVGGLADVNAAVQAKAQAELASVKDNFNDIFSALDAKPTGLLTENEIKPKPDPIEDHFAAPDDVISQSRVMPSQYAQPEIAVSQKASLADIDDDFFADLDEDALLQNGGSSDEQELIDLDIPDLDDSWLGEDVDGGDVSARAGACLELGDYSGARQILEQEISTNDDVNLKMQLLDVYAHEAEQDAFEGLVLQIEFSSPDEEVLREIDVLRELMTARVNSFSNGGAE
ncbi:Uncharacterised protein [Zhongshania aliphaticivorans]|uniref:FimV N-terminal domain-containing protein n=1 Tax=Zhongshania aliphaticivorans TaxID=1470434 RepID=A0A5S9NJ15_9GAMM|nr:hypothetical protein [Zhongshania aliphaticivorans]CAA0089771.1 Uncharacterised protein [Zhongshania aliphaticivorans]CAA0096751.1 Uncharacterised protein [Zhongshania aliphaticivorans]